MIWESIVIIEDPINDVEFIIISSDNTVYSDNIKYFVESLVKQINLEETLRDLVHYGYYNFI